MPLSPAELELVARVMDLLANFEDAPPERLVRQAVLALRDKELQDREAAVLAHLPDMHPRLSARALGELARGKLELADDLADTLPE